jgi:hypothetical protein
MSAAGEAQNGGEAGSTSKRNNGRGKHNVVVAESADFEIVIGGRHGFSSS